LSGERLPRNDGTISCSGNRKAKFGSRQALLARKETQWMSQSKVDLNTIKSALRHASIATTLTYARLGADPAREAIEDYGQRVLAIAGKTEPADVIKITIKS
jgi:hypothetical protein